jgi:cobalt/nickel transport system permease protein
MTAILAIQALIFQDGGVLALGANVLNMAVAGVLVGYLPYYLWGAGRWRRPAIFLGGCLSVFVSALLAVGELLISGIRMPGPVLGVSLGLFLVSAILEGAITVAVAGALEAMQPDFLRKPSAGGSRALAALGGTAVLLAVVGVMFASTHPDGLEKLAENVGIASRATALVTAPLSDYQAGFGGPPWFRKAAAGLVGLLLIWGACLFLGRVASRRRSGT